MESIYQLGEAGKDAHHAAQEAQAYYEHVPSFRLRCQLIAFQLEVEVARPNEGEHRAGEAADETHEYREVGNRNGKQQRDQNQQHSTSHGPNTVVAVSFPARRHRLWSFAVRVLLRGTAFEERFLEQLRGGVIRQWV